MNLIAKWKININLIFNPTNSSTIIESHCSGNGYSITVGTDVYNETNPIGTSVLQNIYGCDSTINVILVFNSTSNFIE